MRDTAVTYLPEANKKAMFPKVFSRFTTVMRSEQAVSSPLTAALHILGLYEQPLTGTQPIKNAAE